MGFISGLKNVEKRFAWSFLGFVLAAIFGGITIYIEFFRTDEPIIQYEVIGNTSILELREDVSKLKIIYDDLDIKEQKKALTVISFRVKNDGRKPLLKTHYDENAPLGFIVNSGKIITSEKDSSSNAYLQKTLQVTIQDENKVLFSEVIIDPGENFVIKTLILHEESIAPIISPIGKIAGLNRIKVSNLFSDEQEQSFWKDVFHGSIFVHLIRIPVYFFGFIFSIILIFAPIAIASEKLENRKQNKIINQFKTYTKTEIDPKYEAIFEAYRTFGLKSLEYARDTISNEDKLKSAFSELNRRNKIRHGSHSRIEANDAKYRKMYIRKNRGLGVIGFLKKPELIIIKEGNILVDDGLMDIISEFIKFASIKQS